MFIVFEGSDGTGKSTLAKAIATMLAGKSTVMLRGYEDHITSQKGVQLISRGQPVTEDYASEYVQPLAAYKKNAKMHVLCDRWHMGEAIYGPLYRGESMIDTFANDIIEQKLREVRALLVHVDAPLNIVQKRLGVRGEDFLLPRDVATVVDLYRRMFTSTDVPSIRVDTHIEPTELSVTRVIDFASALEAS